MLSVNVAGLTYVWYRELPSAFGSICSISRLAVGESIIHAGLVALEFLIENQPLPPYLKDLAPWI